METSSVGRSTKHHKSLPVTNILHNARALISATSTVPIAVQLRTVASAPSHSISIPLVATRLRHRRPSMLRSSISLAALPLMSIDMRRASCSAPNGREASPWAPLARLAQMIRRAELPSLPRLSLPRILARLRMNLAVRRAGGERLQPGAPFRLHGLGWHHMAIAAHLRALQKRAESGERDAAAMEGAFAFVLGKVWRTYNGLERDVLFPWIAAAASDEPRVRRALGGFAAERDRIDRAAAHVHSSMRALSHGGRRTRRAREVAAVDAQRAERSTDDIALIAYALAELLEDAERLHRAERDILFPIIAQKFSESDQRAFTVRMVRAMDTGTARLQLVNYYETIKHNKEQLRRFHNEVPAGVRMFLPMWKVRWYDKSPLAELHSDECE